LLDTPGIVAALVAMLHGRHPACTFAPSRDSPTPVDVQTQAALVLLNLVSGDSGSEVAKEATAAGVDEAMLHLNQTLLDCLRRRISEGRGFEGALPVFMPRDEFEREADTISQGLTALSGISLCLLGEKRRLCEPIDTHESMKIAMRLLAVVPPSHAVARNVALTIVLVSELPTAWLDILYWGGAHKLLRLLDEGSEMIRDCISSVVVQLLRVSATHNLFLNANAASVRRPPCPAQLVPSPCTSEHTSTTLCLELKSNGHRGKEDYNH
jgi:hypothetical protein